jgi:hypothetical protein
MSVPFAEMMSRKSAEIGSLIRLIMTDSQSPANNNPGSPKGIFNALGAGLPTPPHSPTAGLLSRYRPIPASAKNKRASLEENGSVS